MKEEHLSDREYRKRSAAVTVGDSIGVAHFLVANLLILLGEITNLFNSYGGRLPGLEFVYRTFDWPVYMITRPFIHMSGADAAYPFFAGELVIVASSLVYGFLAYLLVSGFLYFFMD